jgi:ABC-type histidine transport system ATPase subunit
MLFDEPTSALNPSWSAKSCSDAQPALDGMTMIVVTQEMAFAEDVADVVVVLDYGAIVEQGPPSRSEALPESAPCPGVSQPLWVCSLHITSRRADTHDVAWRRHLRRPGG